MPRAARRPSQNQPTAVVSSRRYYNGAVRNLNTMIESFPTNFIATQFKFQKSEFFEIGDAAAREVPKVEFKT